MMNASFTNTNQTSKEKLDPMTVNNNNIVINIHNNNHNAAGTAAAVEHKAGEPSMLSHRS